MLDAGDKWNTLDSTSFKLKLLVLEIASALQHKFSFPILGPAPPTFKVRMRLAASLGSVLVQFCTCSSLCHSAFLIDYVSAEIATVTLSYLTASHDMRAPPSSVGHFLRNTSPLPASSRDTRTRGRRGRTAVTRMVHGICVCS